MVKIQVITNVSNMQDHLSEEEQRQQRGREIKELNAKTREDARKARHPSAAQMAQEIRSMVKMADNPYEPVEAKRARALLTFFLKELSVHKQGKHVQVAQRLQSQMKEKQPLLLWVDDAAILANAAIRYDVTFGRVVKR